MKIPYLYSTKWMIVRYVGFSIDIYNLTNSSKLIVKSANNFLGRQKKKGLL